MADETRERSPSQAFPSKLPMLDEVAMNASIFSFQVSLWIAAILITSGLLHLALLAWLGADWNGPLSLRKPALFGISGGLTVWSIAWLMTQLRPQRFDRLIANLTSMSLFIEVGLITLQYWRGESSHFNHATVLDASIEDWMFALILFAIASIFYLTIRTVSLRAIDRSQVIAIRGGMWLLSLSCVLGILTTIFGEINIQNDRYYEYWGRAGVLKFPHGAVLHAIQLLPILSWLAQRLRVPNPGRLVWSALTAQIFFLSYALRQTLVGKARFDWDVLGGLLLGATGILIAYPIVMIATTFTRPKLE